MTKKRSIYIFQEFCPHLRKFGIPEILHYDGSYYRAYGWSLEDEELGERRILSSEVIINDILRNLIRNKLNPSDYSLENLPLNGTDPLLSCEGNLKAYGQEVGMMRFPLFDYEMRKFEEIFQREVEKLSGIEIAASSLP